jgi:hypothetical protein
MAPACSTSWSAASSAVGRLQLEARTSRLGRKHLCLFQCCAPGGLLVGASLGSASVDLISRCRSCCSGASGDVHHTIGAPRLLRYRLTNNATVLLKLDCGSWRQREPMRPDGIFRVADSDFGVGFGSAAAIGVPSRATRRSLRRACTSAAIWFGRQYLHQTIVSILAVASAITDN